MYMDLHQIQHSSIHRIQSRRTIVKTIHDHSDYSATYTATIYSDIVELAVYFCHYTSLLELP